ETVVPVVVRDIVTVTVEVDMRCATDGDGLVERRQQLRCTSIRQLVFSQMGLKYPFLLKIENQIVLGKLEWMEWISLAILISTVLELSTPSSQCQRLVKKTIHAKSHRRGSSRAESFILAT
ncbi:hypothetical protein Tco_1024167, partial [Tanacetum coccineum]